MIQRIVSIIVLLCSGLCFYFFLDTPESKLIGLELSAQLKVTYIVVACVLLASGAFGLLFSGKTGAPEKQNTVRQDKSTER